MQRLDRWVEAGNVILGRIYDSTQFPNGTKVRTEAVYYIDFLNNEAYCQDGKYKLEEPGELAEYTPQKLRPSPAFWIRPNG